MISQDGSVLTISGLSKRYGDVVAVDDVALEVPRGRIVGFVGPNGAGKSTTMRSIFGLVRPDLGSIMWDGAPVDASTRERFGYMPEQRGLYPKMRIAEQVQFFAELKGSDRDAARSEANELLAALDLGDRLEDPLEKLSHGNQQRVQLAVSLVAEPELLVLDEPFNGLDPVAVTTLHEVVRDRVDRGAGVLFSSHQLDLVEQLCDELVVIVAGRVRAAGRVHDVRADSGPRRLAIAVDPPAAPLGPLLAPLAEHGDVVVRRADDVSADIELASDEMLSAVLEAARPAGPLVRFDYDLPWQL